MYVSLIHLLCPPRQIRRTFGEQAVLEEPLVHQKTMPVSIRNNWSKRGPMKNRCRILLGEAWSRRAAATGFAKDRCRSVFTKTGPGKAPWKIAFGSCWAKHGLEELQQPASLKTDACQYSQKLAKERAHEKSLSDPVGRSMVSKSCSNRPHQKPMPVSIQKN